MRFMSKLGIVVAMAGLVALMAGPVSAQDITISCDPVGNTTIVPNPVGNVTLVGTLSPSQCNLPNGATITGNLIVTGTAAVQVVGTVTGNLESSTSALFVAVDVLFGGVVEGNLNAQGTGSIRVRDRNGGVNGDVTHTGSGNLTILGQGGLVTVGGNVIHEGCGRISVFGFFSPFGRAVVCGNVEARGGGGGFVFTQSGGTTLIKGNTCGVEVITEGRLAMPPAEVLGTISEICAIFVDRCPILVDIDIKPGSDPNCFNNDGHGVIPVAILTTPSFDAATVDPFTVVLDGAGLRVKGKSGNAGSLEDVDGDGDLDLVLQIEDVDSTYSQGTSTATLTGQTFDGTPIEGTDSICITQ